VNNTISGEHIFSIFRIKLAKQDTSVKADAKPEDRGNMFLLHMS
jgi:hypothetical protein